MGNEVWGRGCGEPGLELVLASHLTSCVTLARFLPLSEPQPSAQWERSLMPLGRLYLWLLSYPCFPSFSMMTAQWALTLLSPLFVI